VLDLRTLFDFPPRGISNLDSVLVLRSGTSGFAIVADAIGGVHHIPLNELQAELPTLTGIRERYLRGVTAGRRVVFDGAALLSDESLVVREQVQ
jgi:purine-binding chemotaxis protein CheW